MRPVTSALGRAVSSTRASTLRRCGRGGCGARRCRRAGVVGSTSEWSQSRCPGTHRVRRRNTAETSRRGRSSRGPRSRRRSVPRGGGRTTWRDEAVTRARTRHPGLPTRPVRGRMQGAGGRRGRRPAPTRRRRPASRLFAVRRRRRGGVRRSTLAQRSDLASTARRARCLDRLVSRRRATPPAGARTSCAGRRPWRRSADRPDLGQRGETAVAVERVFDALGHDRPGRLHEPPRLVPAGERRAHRRVGGRGDAMPGRGVRDVLGSCGQIRAVTEWRAVRRARRARPRRCAWTEAGRRAPAGPLRRPARSVISRLVVAMSSAQPAAPRAPPCRGRWGRPPAGSRARGRSRRARRNRSCRRFTSPVRRPARGSSRSRGKGRAGAPGVGVSNAGGGARRRRASCSAARRSR